MFGKNERERGGGSNDPKGNDLFEPVSSIKDKWQLLPLFLNVKGLVKQHIESFDYFVSVDIKKIVEAFNKVESDIDPSFYLKYTNVYVGNPVVQEDFITRQLTPQECRLREISYTAPIFVDVEYTRSKQLIIRKGIQIGRLPIMLKSSHCVLYGKNSVELTQLKECPLDPGGYFVTKGVEKVVLIQEQLSKNRILIDNERKGILIATVTSATHERISKTHVVIKKEVFCVRHNSLIEEINVAMFFKAMGITSDKEIVELVCGEESLLIESFASTIEDCILIGAKTQSQALEYIGARTRIPRRPSLLGTTYGTRKALDDGRELLTDLLLSHIPVQGLSFHLKCLHLGLMVRRLIEALHKAGCVDDRDYVGNKRYELAGDIIGLLFEDLFKLYNSSLKLEIDKTLSKPNRTQEFDVLRLLTMNQNKITEGLIRTLSTGNLLMKRWKVERKNATQPLCRFSYLSALGHLMRITSAVEKSRKVSGPRSLQTSQWGMLCPADTPEGESCGLVKNLALMSHITTAEEEGPILKTLLMLGVEEIHLVSGKQMYHQGAYLVLLNGLVIGLTKRPEKLAIELRTLRRAGHISEFISCALNSTQRLLMVSTDGGRICRPLIIVSNGRPRITDSIMETIKKGAKSFQDLLKEGLVEYLDVNEENDAHIALYEADIEPETTTHLEIDPSTILGVVAGLIPYPHHNQSPRNTYQCAMGKQAMGVLASNQFQRFDTIQYLLNYPQKPLVKSRTIELTHYDKLPAGQNAMVAVMSYSGYDIEDALILNGASLDRGFGRCMVMKKVTALVRKYPNGSHDRIAVPATDPISGARKWPHETLDVDGIAAPGERLLPGQIYLNKQSPLETAPIPASTTGSGEYKNSALIYRTPAPCCVDKVILTTNDTDQTLVKFMFRSSRRPELGDKFSSRHGQKGVCGLIVPQEDLPFTDQGLCPDIIMNPHGFPSRMTVGKMLELLAGKAAILEGRLHYGTAFGGSKVEDLSQILIEHGYSYSGKDTLTSGITGEPLEAYIFFGPVYYQKLKHMVLDKMHSRARGTRAPLTRQPTEGRAKDGGLRLGEMERDCLIGYGASACLMERLMISSDLFTVHICETCGLIGYQGWCNLCKNSKNVTQMAIPYAAKLLFQELQSMNIAPRLRIEHY